MKFLKFSITCFVLISTCSFVIAQDSYEIDDTYAQANVLVVSAQNDGTYTQAHTLHQVNDVDWIKFYAVAGESYAIKVFNLNQTNPYIELFDKDGQTSIKLQNTDGVLDAEEILDWTCPDDESGIYYARVGEYFPVNYNQAAAYDIVLYQPVLLELPAYFTGAIKNNFNQSVAGASVVLSGPKGSGAGISASNGAFVASAISGSYSVSVSAPGHSDWSGGVNVPGSITITLNRSSNNAPIANPDEFFIIGENGVASGNILSNDTDGDNDPLYAVLDSNVSNGTLQLNSNGSFTYTGSGGNDSFAYYATDTVANSAIVKVVLTQGKINLPFLMLLLTP